MTRRRKPAPAKADKAELAAKSARGDHAERLLQDPLIRMFLDSCEAECIATWRASPIDAPDMREDAWRMLKTVERFRASFVATIENGKFAADELKLAEASEQKQKPPQPQE